jgi:hypothetical protein
MDIFPGNRYVVGVDGFIGLFPTVAFWECSHFICIEDELENEILHARARFVTRCCLKKIMNDYMELQ